MDTLGTEPRASRMLSGGDTTTPRALDCILHSLGSSIFAKRGFGSGHRQTPRALLASRQTGELLQPDTLGHVAWIASQGSWQSWIDPQNGVAKSKLGCSGTEGRSPAVAEW